MKKFVRINEIKINKIVEIILQNRKVLNIEKLWKLEYYKNWKTVKIERLKNSENWRSVKNQYLENLENWKILILWNRNH